MKMGTHNHKSFSGEVDAEVSRLFDSTSLSNGEKPKLLVIAGPERSCPPIVDHDGIYKIAVPRPHTRRALHIYLHAAASPRGGSSARSRASVVSASGGVQ